MEIAIVKASELKAIAKNHCQFQKDWDFKGYAQHKALGKELRYDAALALEKTTNTALAPEIRLSLDFIQPNEEGFPG